jgi:hypothetical protein
MQNAISDHAGLGQALEEDPFMSQSSQPDLEGILGIAISNMKSAGYTVGEVGATNSSFTKKVPPPPPSPAFSCHAVPSNPKPSKVGKRDVCLPFQSYDMCVRVAFNP